jgi:hypothetical protein
MGGRRARSSRKMGKQKCRPQNSKNRQDYIKLYRYLNILQKTGATFPNRKALSPAALDMADITRKGRTSNHQTERKKPNKLRFLNRPPQLDPEQNTNISNTVIDILKRTEIDPKKAKIEDLKKIINADKSDALTQLDSVQRLTVAMNVASRFLIDREYQKEVRVSLSQNNKGKWIAEPFVRSGRLQYTFTADKIIHLKRQLDVYTRNLNRLEMAHGAIVKIINGEYIDENEDSVRMLYAYIRAKKNEFSNSAKDPEKSLAVKEAAERCFTLFAGLQEEVNAYFSNSTDE